ncbi:MAG: benzoate degradation ring-cleavage hydrolase [Anaerolineae bacterium]|jgi:pimeloyl-ACP methyl ester carboxylesterase|nr:MAG: benzoate degradation ring-cleavage hydrolase [Anaerolineae bacterium]
MNSKSLNSQHVRIRGHEIYLEQYDSGKAPLVVLLHHGLGSLKAWQAQLEFLMAHDISVLAYDRWGYGRSDDRPSLDPPDFKEDVRDLKALLSKENKALVLVGHSDGGNIALMYASRYPYNLLGVIVVAAHIYFEPRMAVGIQELLRSYQESDVFQKGLQRQHEGKAVFERWFQAWAQLGVEWDLRQNLALIQCPVLVVQGSEDEHATVQHAIDCAAALPKGRVEIVEGASHMLPQKSVDVFNQILIQSLLEFQKVDQHV